MDWELRHIRCLIAVADTGSITDAAIELGISQPQASRTVRALEQAWGVRLLTRSGRETTLTPEGERAVEQGRHLVSFAETIAETARGHRHIRLGYVSTAAGRHTPALQRIWREVEPAVDLRLIHAKGQLAGLAEGICDAAVLRNRPDPERYSAVRVGTEPLVAACADNDLWSSRRRLRLKDFAGRPLVINRQSDLRLDLWGSGIGPLPAFDVTTVDDWLDAVAAGRGVGVTTEATAHQHRPIGLRYIPISDAPQVPVHLVWPRGQSAPGTQTLEQILRSLYSPTPADSD